MAAAAFFMIVRKFCSFDILKLRLPNHGFVMFKMHGGYVFLMLQTLLLNKWCHLLFLSWYIYGWPNVN